MLLFAVDDEPKMLRRLHKAIEEAAPNAEILDFPLGSAALEAIEKEALRPDVVFSDIRMPGLDGLELAVRLKMLTPQTKIVFVTGYDYAVDAFSLHVNGYVMKPVEPQRIREELNALDLPKTLALPQGKLRVRCFGHFEVFWQGKPVIFQRKQSKELFAYLVDQEGHACSAEEIAAVLWEDEDDIKAAKHRIRNLIGDLKSTLHEIHMDEVLIRERRQLAIRQDKIDCDYYRMLAGDMQAINDFRGEYMVDYSWAELTSGKLQFRDIK